MSSDHELPLSSEALVTAHASTLIYPERLLSVAFPLGQFARRLLVLSTVLLVVIAIQITAGAYRGERDNYSDEAAHFMNGLLVRDYLTTGVGQNPIRFAEEYYLSYPKIAPLMWPPLFDVALGVAALPGWPPFAVALILLAFATAWTAWRLYLIVESSSSRVVGALLTAIFVMTPVIVDMTSAVMLDMVVAAFALEATYWLALFFRSENSRHAALFGLFSACACLTKGNGVAVVLVPVLMMIFTRKFRLLRHPGLYIAACIVAIIAVAPLAISYRLDSVIGDFAPVLITDALTRWQFYSTFLRGQLTTFVVVLALIGFVSGVPDWRQGNVRTCPFTAAMKALLAAALLFHLANPHRIYAGRYIALAIAPLLALVPAGVEQLASIMRTPRRRLLAQVVAYAAVALTVFAAKPAMASRGLMGFRETVELLQERGLAGRRVLVVSDENGEGGLVTEIAIRRPSPSPTIIRGSKLIASDDWAGRNFRVLFSSSHDLMQKLEDLHVEYLVFDRSTTDAVVPYRALVVELIATNADRFEWLRTVGKRSITTYRLKYRSAGPARPLQIPLPNSLGRTLSR